MIEVIKELFRMVKESPSSLIITLMSAGFVVVYADVRDYISCQRREQVEMNQKFVDALNQIAQRLNKIETKLNIGDEPATNH